MFSSREIECLIHRLRLNSLKTKYCKDVRCMCGKSISVNHLLINCPKTRDLFNKSDIDGYADGSTPSSIACILNNFSVLDSISKCLLASSVKIYL